MSKDPREILANEPMGRLQITAVVICVLMNALDGFDVLSISFASPGIAAEWGIDRAKLGIVLSMELIGMAVGSVFIGNIADRIGRRPTILSCLLVMALGMSAAATASSVEILSIYRFATGLGIGGMLAAINAMVAEYSNARNRSLSVTIMAAGYPLGAVIGGSIASMLLAYFDWRSVFVFGGIATAMFLPVVWFLLPESIEYLMHRRPKQALERINDTLARMGHLKRDGSDALDALPPAEAVDATTKPKTSLALFSPEFLKTTVLLTLGYFAHIMTFYFIIKWIPKIVVDLGYAPSTAGSVLVWASFGGFCGAILFGILTRRFGVKSLVLVTLLLSFALVAWFGRGQTSLFELRLIAGLAGFFTNAAIVGLYAMFAQSYPTYLRASGTGFVIGTGRGGAALGPIVAGFLFAAGAGLQVVALAMATGSFLAAIAIAMLRYRESGSGTESRA